MFNIIFILNRGKRIKDIFYETFTGIRIIVCYQRTDCYLFCALHLLAPDLTHVNHTHFNSAVKPSNTTQTRIVTIKKVSPVK